METLRIILIQYDETKVKLEDIEEELVKSIINYNKNKNLNVIIEIGPYSKFT